MAGPVTETAQAPDLGIGPQIQDPAQKPQAPPPMFGTEPAAAVPPESTEQTPKAGTAAAPAWDWSKADLRRGKPEDVPEEHRAQFEKMQKQFKDVQGETTRRDADLRRREQAAEDRERRLDALERRLAAMAETPQTTASKADAVDAKDEIAEMLKDPDLDPDVKSALELMQKQFQSMWKQHMGDRLAKIDQALPVIERMTTQQDVDRKGLISTQLREAQEKHTAAEIDAYTVEILDAMGLDASWNQVRRPWINRATGLPHTISSLYEWFSGKTAVAAETARAEDADIKSADKKKVGPGNARPSPPASTVLSEAEARNQIKALGFGAG